MQRHLAQPSDSTMGNTFAGGGRHDASPNGHQRSVHSVSQPSSQPFVPRRPSSSKRAPVNPPGPEYAYHSSMASTDIHKGLHNETAAYHCFLNVSPQHSTHAARCHTAGWRAIAVHMLADQRSDRLYVLAGC